MLAGKESMKVLFWSETFWPRVGGVENLAARLLPALRARGYEFAVVTWENTEFPDQIFYDGIPVYRFPFFSRSNQRSLDPIMEYRRQVSELKKRFAPELVHINSFGRSVLFHLSTANAHPTPVLITLHQALADEPFGQDSLLGHLLRTADWVNACSDAVLTRVRQLVPEIIPCSSVIHNALEAPSFDPQPLPFDPPRLLCVGRLVAEKGFDSALTAFATVLDRFPSARLVIAGDGPERQRLTKQMTDLGLINSVEFVGSVPPETVPHLMNKATLVLIPSRLEGFGLVALEAALMARPVVATHVGGLSEVVLHQKTGFLVEQEDEEGLANAILFLLSNPQTASAFGDAARQRAQEVFSFERYVNAHDDLYESLIRKVPRVDDARL
jgi:glycogen(starch) synthase